jgi:drug/metabolite transporter (DMT)-like permease
MSLALPLHARSENIRGIIAMLAAMAVFVVNDTLIKFAAASLPTGETIFIRGVFMALLCGILVVHSGLLWALPQALSPRIAWRALADVGSTVFFLSALVRMPIGDVFGILQFTPLAITAGAALFLGARVGWRRWSATLIGLLGVLIIVRPGGSAFTPFALLAIVSILFSAARDLLTRAVPSGVPALIIVSASAAIVTVSSLGFTLFETWVWPSPLPALILLGASVALLAGQFWLVAAMRLGEIAVVAPFRYSIILWAVLAGYLVWHEVPDPVTWLGIAVVAAAGLYTFLREQQLARAGQRSSTS